MVYTVFVLADECWRPRSSATARRPLAVCFADTYTVRPLASHQNAGADVVRRRISSPTVVAAAKLNVLPSCRLANHGGRVFLLLLFFSEVFDAGAVVKRENQVMQVALRQKPVFGGSKTSGVCLLTEDHAYLWFATDREYQERAGFVPLPEIFATGVQDVSASSLLVGQRWDCVVCRCGYTHSLVVCCPWQDVAVCGEPSS